MNLQVKFTEIDKEVSQGLDRTLTIEGDLAQMTIGLHAKLNRLAEYLDEKDNKLKEEIIGHEKKDEIITHVDIVVAAKVVTPVEPEATPTDQILTTNPTK